MTTHRARALVLLLLVACCDSAKPSEVVVKVAPILASNPKTAADVAALIKAAGPSLLKTFRSRMNFVEVQPQVTEQPGAFSVIAELQYVSFLRPTPHLARLSFILSTSGLVTQCRLEDPVKKAAEVSCSQLEAKLSQLLAPSF